MLAYDIENLNFQYPNQKTFANENITVQIQAGELFGLLGDNGAGKTTLVKQLANLLSPTSGQILLLGQTLPHQPLYVPQKIGYMPQRGSALNNATVSEALYFTAHLRGMTRHDAKQECDRLLELFRLGSVRNKSAPRLSGGQKRLMMLAISLTASPPILILDEPTNDLAPQNRIYVWDILQALNTQNGTTIILVTHNVLEAEKVIQRVGMMRDGKLIAVGRPGELKKSLNQQFRLDLTFDPQHPPDLPILPDPEMIQTGRCRLLINREDATHYIESITQSDAVEDFRLSTATLEDLYLFMLGDD